MKHIAWLTLAALGIFSIKGVMRSSPDRHARDLLKISHNKKTATHVEKEVFENNELRHIATLQNALKSAGANEKLKASGEIEEDRNPAEVLE